MRDVQNGTHNANEKAHAQNMLDALLPQIIGLPHPNEYHNFKEAQYFIAVLPCPVMISHSAPEAHTETSK